MSVQFPIKMTHALLRTVIGGEQSESHVKCQWSIRSDIFAMSLGTQRQATREDSAEE